jgi:signal transduction histidine kinase
MEPHPPKPPVALHHSIAATLASAQAVLVIVLIALGVVATMQFDKVARLVAVTSDGAEALMRIEHTLDLQADALRAYQQGYAKGSDATARSKLAVLLDDVSEHVGRATVLVASQAERETLNQLVPELKVLRVRLAGVDMMDDEEREVVLIELEEAIGDAFAQLDKTKLLARAGLEARLATVKVEVRRPVQLFWGAAGLGVVITIAVGLLLRRRVSQPIVALNRAVAELTQGRATRIAVASRDEVGQLAAAFNNMAATIVERTRSLKLVFDSVGEGLITCDRTGKLVGEPSARAREWFAEPAADSSTADYLAGGDPAWAGLFAVCFEQLVEGVLPFELCADQMPAEVVRNGRIYELKYRPVIDDGKLQRVLVVASDVTEPRELARKERQARDVYALSSFGLRDPSGYNDFVKEITERLSRARRGQSVMMELHTVKGSAGVVGCELFAEAVHDCESHMVEDSADIGAIDGVVAQFQGLCKTADKAIGSGDNDFVVVRRHEYHQLLSLLQITDAGLLDRARQLARSWSMHRVGSSFDRLAKTGIKSAEKQGKRVVVQISGDQICVPKGTLDELWSTLSHLVRNAVVHGIETEEERVVAGKPREGQITLDAQLHDNALNISVRDDGRGIDWQALAGKLSQAEPANDNDRVELLFREGSSTAEQVSELAGRGVGMNAVRQAVLALGGKIDVRSTRGQGTTVEISVPTGGDVYVPPAGLSQLPPYRSKPPPPMAAGAR